MHVYTIKIAMDLALLAFLVAKPVMPFLAYVELYSL